MNDLQAVTLCKLNLLPGSSGNDLTVSFHCDPVELHPLIQQVLVQPGIASITYTDRLAVQRDRHMRSLNYPQKVFAARR